MNQKNQKGITLIALVITIIVLLILAGVTISMVLGDDGIIAQAEGAKEAQENAAEKEETILKDLDVNTDFRQEGVTYRFKNGYLTGVKIEATGKTELVSSMKSKLPSDYFIFESDGQTPAGEGSNVVTGMIVKKKISEDKYKDLGTIIVFGDINGDIRSSLGMNGADLSNALQGNLKLDYVVAGDVDNNGIVNMDDIWKMRNWSVSGGYTKINHDRYACSKNELVIENCDYIKNKYIEMLSSKYEVEYTTWDIEGTQFSEDAITNTTTTTTVKEILDLLPENAGMYIMSEDKVYKKGDEGIATKLVQENDTLVAMYEAKDSDGNFKNYEILYSNIYIVKQ